jgi:pimeloyl-ACP methyl ester carboxylesterase
MKTFVLLVHGFNVSDYSLSIGRLLQPLIDKNFMCDVFDYGEANLVDVRFGNDNLAKSLLCMIRALKQNYDEVVLVGHSNGCCLINLAAHIQTTTQQNLFSRCVYISPALDADSKLARNITKCYVYHTKYDNVVWWAKLLFFHPWGQMGKKGAINGDVRYKNIDCTDYVNGHSDWFRPNNIRRLVETISKSLGETL